MFAEVKKGKNKKVDVSRERNTPEPAQDRQVSAHPLLQIKDLHTYFTSTEGIVRAVNGVSFKIEQSSVLGVVGESGCGKSITALSIMQLLPRPKGKIVAGEILYRQVDRQLEKGRKDEALKEKIFKNKSTRTGNADATCIKARGNNGVDNNGVDNNGGSILDLAILDPLGPVMRRIRGNEIGMIFQEPMTSLNPVYTVGEQIVESVCLHRGLAKKEAWMVAVDMLAKVGIANPKERALEYPHKLSGGMRQRVMIAMALSCNPRLLIADEPTTALDVTIQAQILDLLKRLQEEYQMATMLITHDLGVVTRICDRVVVMYLGKVVESGTVRQILKEALHPYTVGLINSLPMIGVKGKRLVPIRGNVPPPFSRPEGCPFRPRCNCETERCKREPPLFGGDGAGAGAGAHQVRCWLYE